MKFKKSTKSRFPLGKLPSLAIEEVLQTMTTVEKIRLALTSNKMENIVRIMRRRAQIRLEGCVIVFDKHIELTIFGGNEHSVNFCNTMEYFFGTTNLPGFCFWEMKKWMSPKNSDNSYSTVFDRLRQIIPCHSLILHVETREWTESSKTTLMTLTSELKHFSSVFLSRYSDLKHLSLIMDSADKSTDICVPYFDFPSNFHHDKAFQFSSMYYADACWVRTEHLCSLRNSQFVTLYCHKLTPEDINCFVKYWINSDYDMFQILELSVILVEFDMRTVLEGIVALEVSRFEHPYYLIAAKFPTSRKNTVLSIRLFERTLTLQSYSPEEEYIHSGQSAESFSKEYKILRYLNDKIEVERQLEVAEKIQKSMEARIQNLADEYQSLVDEFKISSIRPTQNMPLVFNNI